MITATNMDMKYTPPLNFRLEASQTHGLVGENGIGKTTLLRMVAGQIRATGLQVMGQDPFDNQEVMDHVVLMGIDNPLVSTWTVKKIFKAAQLRWRTWNQARADELVERFGLPLKRYGALSRGQKSAVGIILAVASGCEIMALDEPYLGLDIQRREVFFDVLREEQGKRTIIISTHHLNELSGYLDTIVLLGKSPLSGPVDQLLESIIEVSGERNALDRMRSQLRLPVLDTEDGALGTRILVDARPSSAEQVFDSARQLGLRATEVPLERAVRALQKDPRSGKGDNSNA